MLLLALLLLVPQKPVDGFQARTFKTMPYRLFVPPAYDKSNKYPLVLWLHGAGSVGTDNFKQISEASLRGTHTWTSPQVQAKHPAFVLAPQSHSGSWITDMPLVLELLDSVAKEFNIDAARVYVAGQSMGGNGTWHFITSRPDLFAAAIPLCGWGDVTRANRIAQMPIWAFHGAADPTVPVAESRKMIEAVRKAGGNPRYTEYKGVGHDVWFKTFQEPGLVEWLFAQHK
jgi:predicted peptidase